jgi:hypothetical protein
VRAHTRFVFTPTGPAHLFHAVVAGINRRLALATGGSFTYRFENVLAAQGAGNRDDRMAVCCDNLEDMRAMGLSPSEPGVLRDLGFDPGIAVQHQQGRLLATHYWRLWGLEHYFGTWPPPYLEGQRENPCVYLQDGLALTIHPYIVLSRVTEDIATGRNCIIRGADLLPETSLYAMFAQMILEGRAPLPVQHYVPRLSMVDGEGALIPIASHQWRAGGPGFLRRVRQTGKPPEEFFEYLDHYTFRGHKWDSAWQDPATVITQVSPDPWPLDGWTEFLWGRKPKGARH